MEEQLFVIIYEKLCIMRRNDREIRLCRAYTKADAEIIAKEHGKKFFRGWSIAINSIIWEEDDTAFISYIFEG